MEGDTIFLSPYFDKNSILIANMCRKCYKKCEDVKITGANVAFLNKFCEDKEYLKKVLNYDFKGFSEQEMKDISNESEQENIINIEEKLKGFKGFTEKNQMNSSLESIKTRETYYKLTYKRRRLNKEIKTENKSPYFKDDSGVFSDEKHSVKEIFIPHFIPPKSPHNLIEEVMYHNPWQLLVATIFLNRTTCKLARPYVFDFLEEYPDPFRLLLKDPEELEKYFVKLGLQKTRSVQVWKMSYDFLYKNWKNVGELYGIGKYGEDAYKMFCLGDFKDVPKDRFLKVYRAWYLLQKEEKA